MKLHELKDIIKANGLARSDLPGAHAPQDVSHFEIALNALAGKKRKVYVSNGNKN